MSKNRESGNDNLVGGLTLIGAGLGWLWGALFPGLLLGLGTGLILSALRSQEKPITEASVANEAKLGLENTEAGSSTTETGQSGGTEREEAVVTDNAGKLDVEVVWARILAHQGQVFHQVKGQAFTYEIAGNALIPSTTKAKIYKSQFAKALEHLPFSKVSDVPQGVFGPSYVYAILMDPRIRQNDW